ncbi:MAG: aminotransferase-like domain-containing protein [Candidatus Limnocylindria bacterium]
MNERVQARLTQYEATPGVLDLAWGHPDPTLLPVQELREATHRAMERHGSDILEYGSTAGSPPLIDFICARLAETDARAPVPAEVVITSGASQGLDLAATLLLSPGDTVLLDVPTYHLAISILADHPVRLESVASDADGIVLDDLARVIERLRHAGQRPRMLYTIATFHNPTGRNMSLERRRALVELAAGEDLLIAEDDTYRELAYDGSPPSSLWALDRAGAVVRIGSFAKSVAPGLRLGYVTATPEIATRMATGGLLDSGGGMNHFAATVLAAYAETGDYVRQIERFRAAYRAQRDRLLEGLRSNLPEGASWTHPGGGYFVWVELPRGLTAEKLLPIAIERGVAFLPAHRFFIDDSQAPGALRLAFSMYPPDELEDATARLGDAIGSMSSTR